MTSRRICTLWTNFVKTGNPTPPGGNTDEIGDLEWTTLSEATPGSRYLNIGLDLFMDESDSWQNNMPFWDEVTEGY